MKGYENEGYLKTVFTHIKSVYLGNKTFWEPLRAKMTGFISNKKDIFIFRKPSGRSMTAKLNEFTNELVFNLMRNWTTSIIGQQCVN